MVTLESTQCIFWPIFKTMLKKKEVISTAWSRIYAAFSIVQPAKAYESIQTYGMAIDSQQYDSLKLNILSLMWTEKQNYCWDWDQTWAACVGVQAFKYQSRGLWWQV